MFAVKELEIPLIKNEYGQAHPKGSTKITVAGAKAVIYVHMDQQIIKAYRHKHPEPYHDRQHACDSASFGRIVDRLRKELQQEVEGERERLEEREQFKNSFNEGDIFYMHYRYDKTQIEFFQLVKKGAKKFRFRKIDHVEASRESFGEQIVYAAPVPDAFVDDVTHSKVLPHTGNFMLFADSPIHPASYRMTEGGNRIYQPVQLSRPL